MKEFHVLIKCCSIITARLEKLFAARWDQVFVIVTTSIVPFTSNFTTIRLGRRCSHSGSWSGYRTRFLFTCWTTLLYISFSTFSVVTMLILIITTLRTCISGIPVISCISVTTAIVVLAATGAAARWTAAYTATVAAGSAARTGSSAATASTTRIRSLHLLLPITASVATTVAAIIISSYIKYSSKYKALSNNNLI